MFPLRLPLGLLSHTGILEGGNFPSSTLVGYFCALGPAEKAAHPAPGTGLQTKID